MERKKMKILGQLIVVSGTKNTADLCNIGNVYATVTCVYIYYSWNSFTNSVISMRPKSIKLINFYDANSMLLSNHKLLRLVVYIILT